MPGPAGFVRFTGYPGEEIGRAILASLPRQSPAAAKKRQRLAACVQIKYSVAQTETHGKAGRRESLYDPFLQTFDAIRGFFAFGRVPQRLRA